MPIQFAVYNRFTGAEQFLATIDCAEDASRSIKFGLAVRWAFKNGASLSGADIRGADLGGTDLSGADLRGADIRSADLRDADLRGAYLSGADLRDADLRGADLSGADLSGADLRGAYLSGADLSGADLRSAYLSGADLRSAYLSGADLRIHKLAKGQPFAMLGAPDGWHASTFLTDKGEQRVFVGCRDLTIAEGRAYWAGKPNRREVLAALDYAEAIGRAREWSAVKEKAA